MTPVNVPSMYPEMWPLMKMKNPCKVEFLMRLLDLQLNGEQKVDFNPQTHKDGNSGDKEHQITKNQTSADIQDKDSPEIPITYPPGPIQTRRD
jgi:hypothetical protein